MTVHLAFGMGPASSSGKDGKGGCTRDSTALMVSVGAAALTAATAYTAHVLTKRAIDEEQRLVRRQRYQAEQAARAALAAERTAAKEPPSGTLLPPVFGIEKVYLWELEDLRKGFPSSNLANTMKFPASSRPKILSPILRFAGVIVTPVSADKATANAAGTDGSHHEQEYNKLIGEQECILATIVRKATSKENSTVSYMRAGPRKTLHFDPNTVSAAIVTCGGLCPGLNNVIRCVSFHFFCFPDVALVVLISLYFVFAFLSCLASGSLTQTPFFNGIFAYW
jgi:hypothetical protein